jgi:2'-hydroxyisoflavone reductase
LLILGGTVFLGRHIVEASLHQGHELTLFNRGRSDPDAFADVEQIRGDRGGDLTGLSGRTWDCVIDTSGYLPRLVGQSAEQLSRAVEHYTFVSSVSVYGTFPQAGIDEDAPVAQLPDPSSEDVDRYYGELKAACEGVVQSALPGRALVVRPGLIVGPHDPTDRFTYWVTHLAQGGRVRAPRALEQPVQFIDARDLADWIVTMSERQATGVYNATGPPEPLTFTAMLERIAAVADGRAELVWTDERQLADEGVEPWDELPLWLDLPRHPELRGFLAVDVSRAFAAGLTLRPLEQTVSDTLAWVKARPG